MKKKLNPEKQFYIAQVAATLDIENMPIDNQTYEYLAQIASGEKTAEQVISTIKMEYDNG